MPKTQKQKVPFIKVANFPDAGCSMNVCPPCPVDTCLTIQNAFLAPNGPSLALPHIPLRSRADGASHCGGAYARAVGRAARAARGHPPGTRRSVHAISRLDAQLCRPTAAGQEAQAGLSELQGAVVADDRHKRAHACTAHPTAHRTSSRAHTHRALKGAPEPFRCRFVCRPPCSRAASAFVAPPQEDRPLHERL